MVCAKQPCIFFRVWLLCAASLSLSRDAPPVLSTSAPPPQRW